MGKPTGFMEYQRQGNPTQSPLERIRHYNEFHPRPGREDRRRQGARCMECGVPFCQSGAVLSGMVSGCPLHNLLPEWNDLVYTGNFGHALERLLKTNNFPEFTGRVCPALCEAACTCGLHGDPVIVKETAHSLLNSNLTDGAYPVARGKHVVIVGGGDTSNDCVGTCIRHGCAGVIQLEMMPKAPACFSLVRNSPSIMSTAPSRAIQVMESLSVVAATAMVTGDSG